MSELTGNSYKPLPGQEPIVRHRRSDKRRKKKKENRRELIGTILYIVIICAFVFVVLRYVGQRTVVRGHSMDPTLNDGENLIMDKFTYHFADPERYDIVIFPGPEEDGEQPYYIKRVIALPGETIQIKNGKVYIDDVELTSDVYGSVDYIDDDYRGIAIDAIQMGSDEYFCMGDNRLESYDSRYEAVGPVRKSEMIGKVWLRIWPLDKAGKVR